MARPKARTLQQRFGFMDDDLKSSTHDEIMMWLNDNMQRIVQERYWTESWDADEVHRYQKGADEAVESASTRLNEERLWLEKSLAGGRCPFGEYQRKQHERRLEVTTVGISQIPQWSGLGDPPQKPPPTELVITWEEPVLSGKYTIGFIDMRVCFSVPYLDVLHIAWYHTTQKWLPSPRDDGEPFRLPEWRVVRPRLTESSKSICFEVKTSIPSLGELIRQIRMYQSYVKDPFIVVSPEDRFAQQLSHQGIDFLKYDGQ